MPKFRLTLHQVYDVDTDDWGTPDENAYEQNLADYMEKDKTTAVTDTDRCEALRQVMENDGLDMVVDLNEISELDFTIEVVK